MLEYVTGYTYIVSSNVSDASKLSDLEGVRWAGSLQPGDKISDNLMEQKIGDTAKLKDDGVVLKNTRS